jgi:hypothetical protein
MATDLRRALSIFRTRVHTAVVKGDMLGYTAGFASQENLSKTLAQLLTNQIEATFASARKRLGDILRRVYQRGNDEALAEMNSYASPAALGAENIISNAQSELDNMLSYTVDRIVTNLGSAKGSDTRYNLYQKIILPNLLRPLGSRLNTLVETNITRVYNAGKLDQYEAANINSVGVRSEHLGKAAAKALRASMTDRKVTDAEEDEYLEYIVETAGDDNVCEICQGYDGIIFSLEEARDLIPAHPNCRCAVSLA